MNMHLRAEHDNAKQCASLKSSTWNCRTVRRSAKYYITNKEVHNTAKSKVKHYRKHCISQRSVNGTKIIAEKSRKVKGNA
jgi:ribosomal protein L36